MLVKKKERMKIPPLFSNGEKTSMFNLILYLSLQKQQLGKSGLDKL